MSGYTLTETRLRQWIWIWGLALLIHALAFLTHVNWDHALPQPQRVAVEQIDARKLEEIRNQWKKRQLLIQKNPAPADRSVPPPPDARYESDRNTRVEREQKARNTQVMPKAGNPLPETPPAQQAESKPESRPQGAAQPIPHLENLGLPFRLNAAAKAQPNSQQNSQPPRGQTRASGDSAGDQSLREKLPEGSENLLNTQESIYYSFYSRIYGAIGPIWQSHTREVTYRQYLRPGDYSTVVDVVLDPSGELLEIRHVEDSGIPELDQAVDSSWHQINRFPNPPHGLLNEERQLHMVWTFTVHIDEGAGIQYLPPERSE